MWRTPLSIVLSGVLGSVLGTIGMLGSLIWLEGGAPDGNDLWLVGAVSLTASMFTIPGAVLLSLVEFALSTRVRSDRTLDMIVVGVGASAGATWLDLLTRNRAAYFAFLGGLFGLVTAMLFVFFQRRLGSRRELNLYGDR